MHTIDFLDGGGGDHFGFPIETILAIFDQHVAPNSSSQLAFGSEEEAPK